MRLDAEGRQSPLSHSESVGGATSSAFASATCEVPESFSHLRSRFMPSRLGDSLDLAIGYTSYATAQNCRVGRTTRTFWERTEEALRERSPRVPVTQAHVARTLKLSAPSVNDWTKPGGYPTIENAISLATYLNVNVEWLLTERGPKRALPQDSLAQKLWEYWPQLDEATKVDLLGIAAAAYGRLHRDSDISA
jgi:transcriptional regulator with XRE-family HTH domain